MFMPEDHLSEVNTYGFTARFYQEDRMDLKELGSRLRAERQRQGLTIEQIMEITKISRVNINAIEDGDQSEFPHAVYAKGFVKNYAKALGMNSDEIGEEFSKLISFYPENDEIFKADEPQQVKSSETTKSGSFGIIVLIVLLIGVVGGLVYYLHDNSVFDLGSKQQTEVVAEQAPDEEQVPQPPVEPEVEKNVEEQSNTAPAVEETAEVQQQSAEQAEEQAASEEAAPAPQVEAQPEVSEKLVEVTAKPGEACWIETIVDGNRKEYVLQENDTLSLPYDESLKIKLGNAGGVEIKSAGKPFEFDSSKGKVMTFEFTAAQ